MLKDLDERSKGHILKPKDRKVANHCWIMLSDTIETGILPPDTLKRELEKSRCIPNNDGDLYYPSRIFFADRPELVTKFDNDIGPHSIPRPEEAWVAMEASGVRRVSQVIRGYVSESPNCQEDKEMAKLITDRSSLIRTILEAASTATVQGYDAPLLNALQFLRTDEVKVQWILEAFDLNRKSRPEAVSAHWDGGKQVIYYTRQPCNTPTWSAISRELALAFGFGKNLATVSPGLKTVLEASTYREAKEELANLGISSIKVLDDSPAEQSVVKRLGSDSLDSDREDELWTIESDSHDDSDVSDLSDDREGSFVQDPNRAPSIPPPPGSRADGKGRKGGSERRPARDETPESPYPPGLGPRGKEATPSGQEASTEPFAR